MALLEEAPHAVRVTHTAHLAVGELREIRTLLDDAFPGGTDGAFTDEDWQHTVGGLHATVWEGTRLLAHGSVVQRNLLHGGRVLRTGYLEGVAVRADRRGHGYGGAVLAALEDCVRRAYQLGALCSSSQARGLYAARGWRRWQGRTLALTPEGLRPTPKEDGAVFVLPPAGLVLDETGDLVCDWREGDVW
jgi:aminoglycoside 2'-N-acetyltransferase I